MLIEEDGHNYEIGGDFEFALGPGRLKLIGLDRFSHSFPIPSSSRVSRINRRTPATASRGSATRERIGRLEYRWNMAGGDWRVSAEAAFNSLATSRSCSSSTRSASSSRSRSPAAPPRVEEDRYEVMASHGRA